MNICDATEKKIRDKKKEILKEYLLILTPERVLEVAYGLYVVDSASEEERRSQNYAIAKIMVGKFLHLCKRHTDLNTAEGRFLFSLESIVISLSRAINRRKNTCQERLAAASEKKDRQIKELGGGTIKIGFIKACWRALLMGGLGYSLAQSILPGLHLGENKPPTIASLAVAIGMMLLGSFVKSLWTSYRTALLFSSYENARVRAENAYKQGVRDEYRRSKADAARCWKEYTGRTPEKWLGFDAILDEDINFDGVKEPIHLWSKVRNGAVIVKCFVLHLPAKLRRKPKKEECLVPLGQDKLN